MSLENSEALKKGELETAHEENLPINVQEEIVHDIKYGANSVIQIFVPVTICMCVVAFLMARVGYYARKDLYLPYTPFHSDTDDAGVIIYESLLNTFIILAIVISMTTLLAVLYYCRCYKVIYVWIIGAGVAILFFLFYTFLLNVFDEFGCIVDIVTSLLSLWNFAWLGMLVTFWRGPLRLQQAYLICMSVLLTLFLIKHVPEWTTWFLLAFVSIWDLIAVLHPRGPLKVLVELARERGEPLVPALVYSSTIVYDITGDNDKAKKKKPQKHVSNEDTELGEKIAQSADTGTEKTKWKGELSQDLASKDSSLENMDPQKEQQRAVNEDDDGIKLGLGDFIFYSILIGKSCSTFNSVTVVASLISILIGLCCTLVLLTIYRKALPALPISVFFGLTTNFAMGYMGSPMIDRLAISQIVV